MICRFDGCDDDGVYGAHGVPLCRLHEDLLNRIPRKILEEVSKVQPWRKVVDEP